MTRASRFGLRILTLLFGLVLGTSPVCANEQKIQQRALLQQKALATKGDAAAQTQLGLIYANGKGTTVNPLEAIKWFRLAAAQNYAEAQFQLGIMYAFGHGLKQDDQAAVDWYQRAAAQAHARAQNELGLMHDRGRGVRRDDAEAVKWYRLAAEQGDATAQVNLGIKYDLGHGVRQSYREAVKWFRAAADQGNASALNNLGVMYADGLGVTVSRIVAHALYHLSATVDPSAANQAGNNRNAIARKMTASEIDAAQALARELSASKTLLKTLDVWCAGRAIKLL
ncbi:MAG: sel1 repeat family protein [Rhodocyclaceae bacterium]|nr:sel1 repeat family protein [Rhodocyclaceae bacterium]